jgi:hypothetical protein
LDWFERLTGFIEVGYDDTRSRLEIVGQQLRSRTNGSSYGIGELELASLRSLRQNASSGASVTGRLTVRNVNGDVRRMHQSSAYADALFQVASQFNLLEMVSPDVSPEQGVTRYQYDKTQGPACALAAGAGTIYRNYFAPIGDEHGQTRERQLDGLADVGAALGRALHRPVGALWTMQNGYAMCKPEGLAAIGSLLRAMSTAELDALRDLLRIGVHRDVEVTDCDAPQRQFVSQAFCSALPVDCTGIAAIRWQPFAQLVLEAAYEATMWAAVLNAQRGVSNIVLLTRLGGGAFGNADIWIDAAMRRALMKVKDFRLDVRLVSFGGTLPSMLELEQDFSMLVRAMRATD